MFRILLDRHLSCALSTSTSSSLLFPQNRTNTCAPPTGLFFCRFAEQFPLTDYEPKAPVEVSSTEVATTLLPSRKASIGMTCNSGEDIVTTPAVLEVDERSDLGMLASPLLTQERERERDRNKEKEKCDPVQKESSETTTLSYQYGEVLKQEKIKSRLKCCAGASFTKKKNSF